SLRALVDDELASGRAYDLELNRVCRELTRVPRDRCFEPGAAYGAADGAVGEIEPADQLLALLGEDLGELRERDAGLDGDGVVVDPQHAVHVAHIDDGAAVRGRATRRRAARADRPNRRR